MWDTISNGKPSPRKEILLNIDLNPDEEHDLSPITFYEGIAFRQGDMKLLMSVDNASWYKPPELGGKPDIRQHKVGWGLYSGDCFVYRLKGCYSPRTQLCYKV